MTHGGQTVRERPRSGDRDRPGVVGLVLTLLGAASVGCALTFLDWFTDTGDAGDAAGDNTFGAIHDGLSAIALTGTAKARFVPAQYFGWLAWVLLVAVGITAVFACLPTGAAPVFRVLGPLLAVVAVALTFVAIDLIEVADSAVAARAGDRLDYVEYLKQAGPAFYAAVGGFALMGIGARRGVREP